MFTEPGDYFGSTQEPRIICRSGQLYSNLKSTCSLARVLGTGKGLVWSHHSAYHSISQSGHWCRQRNRNSWCCSGNVKWCTCSGISLTASIKSHIHSNIWPSNHIPGYLFQRNKNVCSLKSLYMNVNNSFICDRKRILEIVIGSRNRAQPPSVSLSSLWCSFSL